MTLQKIIQFLGELITRQFTGRIILDFHKGDISKKVKKEIIEDLE